jgi:hypothetical protein
VVLETSALVPRGAENYEARGAQSDELLGLPDLSSVTVDVDSSICYLTFDVPVYSARSHYIRNKYEGLNTDPISAGQL